ncbi:MAG: hypothetical protein Q8N26_11785, partial [Myxococcales bacterium]|nr:hypothetical protein [Myxococcales bacterium]
GGSAAGGSAAGGSAAGGSAAGGSAAGGSAAGGSAAGGSAAGGSAAGGSAGGMASAAICNLGAYDAGRPGGDLFADGGFEPLGMLLGADAGVAASATSTYSGYPARQVLDLDLQTSWYIDSQCTASSSLYCCDAHSIRLDLPTARSISAVIIRGNRDFASSYDIFTARLDFLNASGAVITSRQVVFNRPESDWAAPFTPTIQNVRAVRLIPGWAESSAPGLAEIVLYGQ